MADGKNRSEQINPRRCKCGAQAKGSIDVINCQLSNTLGESEIRGNEG